jgi:GNAT superfamily N-acetyltransferase
MQTVEAAGLRALGLTTDLLHRVRAADPLAGNWEAADFQWWWRTPRRSDALNQRFVVDDEGPVAAALLTAWARGWGLDPIALPGTPQALLADVLVDALSRVDAMGLGGVETLVRDDDAETIELLERSGFRPTDDTGGILYLDPNDLRSTTELQDGFRLVDRSSSPDGPHPISHRSGPAAERRLRQTSLYDPFLDLAIRTDRGEVAGYALFWFDPVTRVGLLEPMRVEDAWQRRGLGRALLVAGLQRLVDRGSTRLKVGWGSPPGHELYLGVGFRDHVGQTTYARPAPG